MIFLPEIDGSSQIKNFIDSLNLSELKVGDVSAKFTAESAKKIYQSVKSSSLNRGFFVFFSEIW